MKMKTKFFKELALWSLKSNKIKIIKESNSYSDKFKGYPIYIIEEDH